MLIRVSDPTFVPALVADLEQRARHVVKQVGGDRVAVGVLGSCADGGELDLTLILLAWQAAHHEATIDLVERQVQKWADGRRRDGYSSAPGA